jgi:hypothetical protein
MTVQDRLAERELLKNALCIFAYPSWMFKKVEEKKGKTVHVIPYLQCVREIESGQSAQKASHSIGHEASL